MILRYGRRYRRTHKGSEADREDPGKLPVENSEYTMQGLCVLREVYIRFIPVVKGRFPVGVIHMIAQKMTWLAKW